MFSKKPSDTPRRRQANPEHVRATPVDLDRRYSFRRSHTLTGSTSPSIASSSEANAQMLSPRSQTHDLAQKRRHIGLTLLLVLAATGLLVGFIAQFTASVVVRTPDVTTSLDPIYERTVQEYLGGHPLERLRFMSDGAQLTAYIQSKLPEVASISLDGYAGFGSSEYVFTMRKPIVGWNVRGQQQYVDGAGVPFERNYYTASVVQIVDKSGIQVAAGQAVASNSFLSFIGQVVGLSLQSGKTVKEITIPQSTTRQIEVTLSDVAYPIKLTVDRAVAEQVEDMVRGIAWMQANNVTPEYLDVRVAGRAFYR